MHEALAQIKVFAAGAVEHAAQVHGVALSLQHAAPDDLRAVEQILLALRHDRGAHEMLAVCYGAWLGQIATERFEACWTGVFEPCPPRLLVGGVACSPIDNLRRFLDGDVDAISPPAMYQRMEVWFQEWKASCEYISANQAAWDRLVDDLRFSGPSDLPESAAEAMASLDPWVAEAWQPGCKVLCLCGAGGRQGPLHAIAGGDVTVVDISRAQLERDREVADARGLSLRLIQGAADNLTGLADGSFDLVIQPVSACYLPDVRPMYREVARVLRRGGVYVVQHKQPVSMRLWATAASTYELPAPFREGQRLVISGQDGAANPMSNANRERGAVEFTHSLQSLLGELCAAGFVITDFCEPARADAFAPPGTASYQASFAPPYLRIRATRV
jgi:hypothetical protein